MMRLTEDIIRNAVDAVAGGMSRTRASSWTSSRRSGARRCSIFVHEKTGY
jgi:hypothetical protein